MEEARKSWHESQCVLEFSELCDNSVTYPKVPSPVVGIVKRDFIKKADLLSELLDARDIIEPLNRSLQEKMATLNDTKPIRLGTLLSYSRRLAPHTRPPPQYNNPSGTDAFCVPGYVFPCPDVQMMLRSTLFLGGAPQAVLRCLPPTIGADLQPGFTAVYQLKLTSSTNNAKYFYSINLDLLRPFNFGQPPLLSAPGEYNIQAYAQAPGFLPSEMSMKVLTLKVHEEVISSISGAPEIEVVKPTVRAQSSSAFGGLFLGDDDDSEDDDNSADD